jgi:uncharacterized membrane protein
VPTQQIVHTAAPDSGFELTLRRNCSITPRGALAAFALCAAFSLAIAIAFAWVGAWMVLPFAGIEMVALAAALVAFARHTGDYEALSCRDGMLVLEARCGARQERREWNAAWVRVRERKGRSRYQLALVVHGAAFEVGRHLDDVRRGALALRLKEALRSGACEGGWGPEYRTQG